MNKIINPCTVDVGGAVPKQVYCRIYTEEKQCTLLDGTVDTITVLHIVGVVGPRSNGDAYAAGQCYDELRQGVANEGWTADSLYKLLDIWQRWHMNDMLPYCEHQRDWDGGKLCKLYEYKMTDDTRKRRDRLKESIHKMLMAGDSVQLSESQRTLLGSKYFVTTYKDSAPAGYELYKEYTKYARELYPMESDTKWGDKHPDGILTKSCPVCGYTWGGRWRAERVPEEVLSWLESLPDSKRTPAWV
jgi:hypothetical protein|nr:MAG TPA: hypothetical protein [Caudoviricetes sp.]